MGLTGFLSAAMTIQNYDWCDRRSWHVLVALIAAGAVMFFGAVLYFPETPQRVAHSLPEIAVAATVGSVFTLWRWSRARRRQEAESEGETS